MKSAWILICDTQYPNTVPNPVPISAPGIPAIVKPKPAPVRSPLAVNTEIVNLFGWQNITFIFDFFAKL